MPRSIEVVIDPTGTLTIEAIGFKGGACTKATEAIEKALGTVADRRKKPEFHQSQHLGNQQTT